MAPAGAANTSQARALSAGSYELATGAAAASSFGSYRLRLAPLDPLAGCQATRTTFGLSAFGATLGRDCTYTTTAGQSTLADGFLIYVPPTKTLDVAVSSTAFPPLIEFRNGTSDTTLGAPFKSTAGSTGSTVSLSMTGGGFIEIWISSQRANAPGGAYTISIAP